MTIDLKSHPFLKQAAIKPEELPWLEDFLIDSEKPLLCFQSVRDAVVFTNRRVFFRDEKGLTASKVATVSMPYSSIVAYSVESAGTLELGSTIDLFVKEIGTVSVEFVRNTNIRAIEGLLARATLAN